MNKQYIGDGVYAEVIDQQIVVTTENGINTTNTIFFDIDTWPAMKEYALRYFEEPK